MPLHSGAMFLDALIERSHWDPVPIGYERAVLKWRVTLTPKGELLSLTKGEYPIIQPRIMRAAFRTNTGIESFRYLFGSGAPGVDVKTEARCHAAYRAQLATVPHPAARAIERFLDNPNRPVVVALGAELTPDEVDEVCLRTKPEAFESEEKLPPIKNKSGLTKVGLGAYALCYRSAKENAVKGQGGPILAVAANYSDYVLVEVEGYPEWWLEPQVQKAHTAYLEQLNEGKGSAKDAERIAGWECSLCGEAATLVRSFPTSAAFGGATFTSFNPQSFRAYGLLQGYNAPTCTFCAERIAQGLLAASTKDTLRVWSTVGGTASGFALWWPQTPEAPNPWPLFDVIMDRHATDVQKEEALKVLGEHSGYFVTFTQVQKRLALRRFGHVEGEVVVARLRRWMDAKLGHHLDVTKTLYGQNVDRGSYGYSEVLEAIYLNLLFNEPFTPTFLRGIERRRVVSSPQPLERREQGTLRSFLSYTSETDNMSLTPIPINGTNPYFLPHPNEEGWTDRQRGLFYAGRLLARLDRNQADIASGVVTIPLRAKEYDACLRSPAHLIGTLAPRYGRIRTKASGNRFVPDRFTSGLLERVGEGLQEFLGGTTKPKPLNPQERACFALGVAYEDRALPAYFAWRTATKSPASVETE